MAQSILCPQCEKRFRLADNPPAQATCSGCGTLMDLTAFAGGGGDQPAPPPQPAASSSPPRPKPHRASRAGAARRRPPPRGGRGGSRGRQPQQQAPQQPAMSAGTQGILIFVGVLILVLIFVVSGKKDADDVIDKPIPPVAEVETPDTSVPYVPEPIADPNKASKKPKKKRIVPLNRQGKPRLSRVQLTTHAWPEEVSAEVRAQADEAIRKMYIGGRDGDEAVTWFVQQGRPACGRLISEFRAIESNPGFDDRNGASMAMVIDGALRKIDGQIERYWDERERIRAWGYYAAPSFITRIAKRWTWWWIEGEWQDNPRKPWDPFEDESDTSADGIKREEPKVKKDPKKKGYGKRAGG